MALLPPAPAAAVAFVDAAAAAAAAASLCVFVACSFDQIMLSSVSRSSRFLCARFVRYTSIRQQTTMARNIVVSVMKTTWVFSSFSDASTYSDLYGMRIGSFSSQALSVPCTCSRHREAESAGEGCEREGERESVWTKSKSLEMVINVRECVWLDMSVGGQKRHSVFVTLR